MAIRNPEALQRIAEALPDTYESNPDQFVSDWEASQRARQDVDRLQEVNRWYEESYKPWWQTYGNDFAEFQQWKQRPAEPESHGAESLISPSQSAIDWNDVDAPRRVYETLDSRLSEVQQRLDAQASLQAAALESGKDEMRRLLALQEQAYGIINEKTWEAIKPGWRPDVNIPEVVRHAQQYNIPDLRRAYEHYSQGDREKALERSAYERGLEEGRRAAAAASVTTEMGNGTPYHRGNREPDRPRGYGRDYEAIMASSQQRTARRGFQ